MRSGDRLRQPAVELCTGAEHHNPDSAAEAIMPHQKLLLCLLVASSPGLVTAANLAEMVRDGDRQGAVEALRAGARVNELLPDGSTALMWAVHRVDHELVRELLARGADPDVRNVLGATALAEAASLSDATMVEMLLKAGADPNLGNDDHQTPLMIAARVGSRPIAEKLLKAGARVNERERYREQTALMWAVAANAPDVVELLIRHGAEVDVRAAANDWGNQITSEPRAQYRNAGGLTPLLFATRFNCLECVKLLLDAGADIDRPTPEGVTPLMNAIDNNNFEIANYLLDRGANPHLFDWWGRTALYLTADMRTRGMRGGVVNAPGAQGAASESGIAGVGFTDAPRRPPADGALQLMRRLLEMGVDPNTQLNMHRPFRGRFTDDLLTTGCTPLLRAALSVDREAVRLLLDHGAIADLPNVMGVTPLMAAAAIGASRGLQQGGQGPIAVGDPQDNAIAVIGMLIDAGADVNARITDTSSRTAIIARPSSMTSRQGQTAIFGAISQDWVRVAKFLIEKGARLDIVDAAGKTVLDALENNAGGRDNVIGEEMKKLIRGALGVTD
jgi:ankyrin repeat protein